MAIKFTLDQLKSAVKPGSPSVCLGDKEEVQTEANYNRGIKIKFHNEYNTDYTPSNKDEYWSLPDFDWSTELSGFNETVQTALIDTLTEQGSDKAHPYRGTTFQSEAYEGAVVDKNDLVHSANFAAETVRTYINNTQEPVFKEGFFDDGANVFVSENQLASGGLVSSIQSYYLRPSYLDYDSVVLDAYFLSSSGEVVGTQVEQTLVQS